MLFLMKLAGSRKNNCDYDESDEFFISKVFNSILVDVAGICKMDEHSTSETFLLAIQILGSFLIVHELWAKVCMASMRFDGPLIV